MVYHFIDNNKKYFGLRWLCRKFGISPNGYYNYLKDVKGKYHEQREVIYERIKSIFYNNNRTIGHRVMRVFLSRYGIYLSKTTVHKYMNKVLNLSAIIMSKKPGYTSGKKHKIFNNLLNQDFTVDEKIKSGVLTSLICVSQMADLDITAVLLTYSIDLQLRQLIATI